MKTLTDILPAQPHYYLLSNGHRYARHGKEGLNGVLVFTLRERAEQFMMTIGVGMPEFQPIKVAAENLLPILMDNGGRLCMTDHRGVIVVTIKESKDD
jgi:hypothetical protein